QKAKVQLVFDKAIEPDSEQRQAIVEVTLAGGEQLREHVVHVRGTTDNPISREEVIAKCRDLVAPVLGAPVTAKLIERVLDLENVKNVRELRPLLLVG